jgi:hypothetical protein
MDTAAGEALDARVPKSGAGGRASGPSREGKRVSARTNILQNASGTNAPAPFYDDEGGPSRFFKRIDFHGIDREFYCAKAQDKERGEGNPHPTVKPIALAKYFARMLLPPKRSTPRRILVPYSGVASEMIGCVLAGWDEVVGIELSHAYIDFARTRFTRDFAMLAEMFKDAA